MRVISQDGTIDITYDYFSLTIASGRYEDVEVSCIFCHNLSSPLGTKLAEYSSKEKAQKVMEMLRNNYLDFMTETTPDGNGFCFNQPKVFQFPKDEDVEE